MSQEQIPESTHLYYTEGSSDKVYQIHLIQVGDGWKVNGLNGRRGSALKEQNKTPDPVDYATARKIYDKLVNKKLKKGYTPEESGEAYRNTDAGKNFTGIVPQLCNTADEKNIEKMITSRTWAIQEKYDGERRMIRVTDGVATGINREGMEVPLPESVARLAEAVAGDHGGDILIDGEIMGTRFVAFDVLEVGGNDIRQHGYGTRFGFAAAFTDHGMEIADFAREEADKRALIQRIVDNGLEGYIFKKVNAPHAAGRPASGGDHQKHKLTESATLIAGPATTGKRSVSMSTNDGVAVGKVTIPANYGIPAPGTLIEVRYLYRNTGDKGALFQPVYCGERNDKTVADQSGSLKVKPETVAPQARARKAIKA